MDIIVLRDTFFAGRYGGFRLRIVTCGRLAVTTGHGQQKGTKKRKDLQCLQLYKYHPVSFCIFADYFMNLRLK